MNSIKSSGWMHEKQNAWLIGDLCYSGILFLCAYAEVGAQEVNKSYSKAWYSMVIMNCNNLS